MEEEIEEIVNQALKLQRKGEYQKAFEILNEAEKKADCISDDRKRRFLWGLIYHHRGRIFQAMKKYNLALINLEVALGCREGDSIQYGYTIFQLYICKTYAGMKISTIEAKNTKIALWEIVAESKDFKQIGDVFQNLGYIEFQEENTEKAIMFYKIAKMLFEEANNERAIALAWARLGECYKKLGKKQVAGRCGKTALKYFKEIGDVERIKQVKKNVL